MYSRGMTKLFLQFKKHLYLKFLSTIEEHINWPIQIYFLFFLTSLTKIARLSLSVFIYPSTIYLSLINHLSLIHLYFSHFPLILAPTQDGYQPPERSLLCSLKMSPMSSLMRTFRFSFHKASTIFPLCLLMHSSVGHYHVLQITCLYSISAACRHISASIGTFFFLLMGPWHFHQDHRHPDLLETFWS